MNKADLINHVAKETKLSKADCERAINSVFKGITNSLKRGQEARFTGFGSFCVAKRAARNGRNPQTGQTIRIPAKKTPKFRPGKELKLAVER